MTDRDFAVWLRNMELAVSREAQARGIHISINAGGEGTSFACITDRMHSYLHWTYSDGEEEYIYTDDDESIYNLLPEEIRIGKEPLTEEVRA